MRASCRIDGGKNYFTVARQQNPSLLVYRRRQDKCREKQIINDTHSLLNKSDAFSSAVCAQPQASLTNDGKKDENFSKLNLLIHGYPWRSARRVVWTIFNDKLTLTCSHSLAIFSFRLKRQCSVCWCREFQQHDFLFFIVLCGQQILRGKWKILLHNSWRFKLKKN